MTSKIIKIIPLAQSIALTSDNIKFSKKKNKDIEDFIGQGMKNIVGVKLIDETIKMT